MSHDRHDGRRRWMHRLAFAVLSLLVAEAACELIVRAGLISPSRQIVRGHNLRLIGDVPVWEHLADRRENRECAERHPERLIVMFFGTSITAGRTAPPTGTFAALLQDRLNAARPDPGFCVLNFAQPGFRHEQMYAVAGEEMRRYRPALVLYQDWDAMWGGCREDDAEYRMIDGAAFHLAGLRLRGDGLPGIAYVPDPLNRWLFRHSYVYQYLAMGIGETSTRKCEEGIAARIRTRELLRFADLVRSRGARPAFFIVPDLSYPLDETRGDVRAQEREVIEFGAAHGFVVYPLRPALADQDYKAMRADRWHLSGEGHRALAPVFERLALSVLDGAAVIPAPPPPAGR